MQSRCLVEVSNVVKFVLSNQWGTGVMDLGQNWAYTVCFTGPRHRNSVPWVPAKSLKHRETFRKARLGILGKGSSGARP